MRTAVPLLLLLALTAPALAGPIEGPAAVVDGDTIEVQGTRIRLHGIDAPEDRQTCQDGAGQDYGCGRTATLALADRIGVEPVSCALKETDRYGRTVAVCRVNGIDLNGWMVKHGFAVSYRLYGTDYTEAEALARLAGRGMWAGDFMQPWEWRLQQRP